MLLIGCLVALILPLTVLAVHQDTYRNVTAQNYGEEKTLVTIDRIENKHTSAVGWQNATETDTVCDNGTERQVTEYETSFANSFDNSYEVIIGSDRTRVGN